MQSGLGVWVVLAMMGMGVVGAAGPVFLKLAQEMTGWDMTRILLWAGFVVFYGLGFLLMLWVLPRAPLTIVVPVWYATLLLVAAALGMLVFGERFSWLGMLGYGLIVAGLMVKLAEALR